jgi:hypothetical protein
MRSTFKLEPRADRGTGDSLDILVTKEHGQEIAYVTIDNPWAGSTKNGFGQQCMVIISKDEARELIEYLAEWAKE